MEHRAGTGKGDVEKNDTADREVGTITPCEEVSC